MRAQANPTERRDRLQRRPAGLASRILDDTRLLATKVQGMPIT